jgi:predicted transcriptional regulator
MAILVKEIRSPELFSLSAEDTADSALSYLLALGISSAPVIDGQGKLCGIVSLRDLIGEHKGAVIAQCMSAPPVSIHDHATIHEAGELIGTTGHHHLPVVDASHAPIGMVSSLDVIRGLLGLPAVHPATSPHYDPETGASWSDDHILSLEHLEEAPSEAGVLVLIRGGMGVEESMEWVESTSDLRARIRDILASNQAQPVGLQRVLAFRELRFRTASIPTAAERERLVTALAARLRIG